VLNRVSIEQTILKVQWRGHGGLAESESHFFTSGIPVISICIELMRKLMGAYPASCTSRAVVNAH